MNRQQIDEEFRQIMATRIELQKRGAAIQARINNGEEIPFTELRQLEKEVTALAARVNILESRI